MQYFTEIKREEIPYLHLQTITYEHNETKAKVIKLTCYDNNNAFMISFNTPLTNSKGCAHIVEHSVLCGSDNYITKEPFADLKNFSLKNYLNAMTGINYTMYPIASVNKIDYINLMKVYLDAVFLPRVRHDPFGFYQEGHHWEINEKGEYEQNGIVYNEMKESESKPLTILTRYIDSKMYSGSYGVCSGGISSEIEKLSYEEFVEFYTKFYHPTNSITTLSSSMDLLEEELTILNGYFSGRGKGELYGPIINENEYLGHIDTIEYPIDENEDPTNKDFFAYVFRLDGIDEMSKYGLGIVDELLSEIEGAPLDEKLKELGICSKLLIYRKVFTSPSLFMFIGQNADATKFDLFKETIDNELKKYIKEGYNKDSILGILNTHEFDMREANYDHFPKGMFYSYKMSCKYANNENPIDGFHEDEYLHYCRNHYEEGYLEKLTEEWLINNTKTNLIRCVPKQGLNSLWKEETLQRWKEQTKDFDEKKKKEIEDICKELKRRQQEPDTPEQKATIPKLSIKDIGEDPMKWNLEQLEKKENPFKIHRQFDNTNGIVYFKYFIDCSDLSIEELQYLEYLSRLMRSFNTEKYTFVQLGSSIDKYFGNLFFGTEVCYNRQKEVSFEETQQIRPQFTIIGKAMGEYLEKGMEVIGEILTSIKFELSILEKKFKEFASSEMMRIRGNSYGYVSKRIQSYLTKAGMITDLFEGITFYQHLSEIVKDFEHQGEKTLEQIKHIYNKIFHPSRIHLFYCCEEENDIQTYNQLISIEKYLKGTQLGERITYPEPNKKNEAIQIPMKTNFVAKGFNYIKLGHQFTAAYKVLLDIIKKDYLWNKIRVENGAYGGFLQYNSGGLTYFISYRDPKLYETLQAYDDIETYLTNLQLTKEELEQYLLGIFSDYDSPDTIEGNFRFKYNLIMSNFYNDRITMRNEILNVTVDDLKHVSNIIIKGLKHSVICTGSSKDQIDEKTNIFEEIINIFA